MIANTMAMVALVACLRSDGALRRPAIQREGPWGIPEGARDGGGPGPLGGAEADADGDQGGGREALAPDHRDPVPGAGAGAGAWARARARGGADAGPGDRQGRAGGAPRADEGAAAGDDHCGARRAGAMAGQLLSGALTRRGAPRPPPPFPTTTACCVDASAVRISLSPCWAHPRHSGASRRWGRGTGRRPASHRRGRRPTRPSARHRRVGNTQRFPFRVRRNSFHSRLELIGHSAASLRLAASDWLEGARGASRGSARTAMGVKGAAAGGGPEGRMIR